MDDNLVALYAWKQVFHGDTVDFDYHLMWEHILDPGQETIARTAYEDVRNFKNLGFNGYISCQLQRNAFPSSIIMTTLAKTLWNRDTDFEQLRRKLYSATFGQEAVDTLCDYFAIISKDFDSAVIRGKKPFVKDVFRANLVAGLKAMEDMKDYIEANQNKSDPCQNDSWKYLSIHRELYIMLAKCLLARVDGDMEKSEAYRLQSQHYAFVNEDIVQSVLDCMYYAHVTNTRIKFLNPDLQDAVNL